MIKWIASSVLLLGALGCGSKGSAGGSPACRKAALPLAGIVVLEVKDSGSNPSVMDTFESELVAACVAQKTDQTSKEALECYDKNQSARGYFLFKACPEPPGRALVDAVVAKHGRR